MISNIHPNGLPPHAAADLTVRLVKEMFKQKCSGVNLKV
jgi:ethanolamine ammonia-lyase small subunit